MQVKVSAGNPIPQKGTSGNLREASFRVSCWTCSPSYKQTRYNTIQPNQNHCLLSLKSKIYLFEFLLIKKIELFIDSCSPAIHKKCGPQKLFVPVEKDQELIVITFSFSSFLTEELSQKGPKISVMTITQGNYVKEHLERTVF